MNEGLRRRRTRARMTVATLLSTLVLLAGLGAVLNRPAAAGSGTEVSLSPGGGAPAASGEAQLRLEQTVLAGSATVEDLPAQPFGSGHFYGLWFVRTDTGDKAFLGALIKSDSIIFSDSGDGTVRFAGTKYTTGPDAGSPITFGPTGKNLVVVLVEDKINGLTPSPVGPVPGTG